jgi:hypothetical protein
MVLKQGADNGNGDIFIAPEGGGPEIISNTGKVIWFHPGSPASPAAAGCSPTAGWLP